MAVLTTVGVLGLPGPRPAPEPGTGPGTAPGAERLASLLECLASAGVTGLSSADEPARIAAEVGRQQPGDSPGRACLVAHRDVVPGS